MHERPILFSGPMVRAILEGRKTQTRRMIKPDWWRCLDPEDVDDRARALTMCPYGEPGDSLWVRERIDRLGEPEGADRWCASVYAADLQPTKADAWPWQRSSLPPMHCPRGLSRITLRVTSVRVERLQEISGYDVVAEGVRVEGCPCERCGQTSEMCPGTELDHVCAFAKLWESINGSRAPWQSNPWVWAVGFERVERVP